MSTHKLARTVLIALALHACFTVTLPFLILRTAGELPPRIALGSLPGLLLLLAGLVLYVAGLRLLVGADTSALPLNDPRHLLTGGLFAYTRNPMLLGVIMVLFGEALAVWSAWLLAYAALYWLWLHAFVVLREEPELVRTFGPTYADYCRRVPRWIPRFRS